MYSEYKYDIIYIIRGCRIAVNIRVFQTCDESSTLSTRTRIYFASVAQGIRAGGFYPSCRGFESLLRYQNLITKIDPYGSILMISWGV